MSFIEALEDKGGPSHHGKVKMGINVEETRP
jgi:hypothetical protein